MTFRINEDGHREGHSILKDHASPLNATDTTALKKKDRIFCSASIIRQQGKQKDEDCHAFFYGPYPSYPSGPKMNIPCGNASHRFNSRQPFKEIMIPHIFFCHLVVNFHKKFSISK